jgi:1-pyrroline-5-carboxylate dehydrogenase
MSKGVFNVPIAKNEAVKSYKKGSSEREELLATYKEMYNSSIEIPLYIGGKEIFTDNKKDISPPHDHKHKIGKFNLAEKSQIEMAIEMH